MDLASRREKNAYFGIVAGYLPCKVIRRKYGRDDFQLAAVAV